MLNKTVGRLLKGNEMIRLNMLSFQEELANPNMELDVSRAQLASKCNDHGAFVHSRGVAKVSLGTRQIKHTKNNGSHRIYT